MSHMVIYRGSDGKPGYHQTDDIHDAVGFVEQMRNDQGVEHARIFRLEEVVFQYKPYYRVELAESGFGELGVVVDTSNDGGPDNGSGNGSNGSGNGELTINANGGGSEAHSGSENSSDNPTPVAAGSASSSTSTSTDDGGSKRGLFGR